ncbi:DUF3137 domain-containing protein [Parvularcula marina]|uniref:DUF3137 domain-containing protein n=1 Tax=Parvularcula marina TaxID=2292771 RepID=A0A371RKL5_9PROT|nr:DUF3137 domain-containing protein [Parvularcula marina]RFB05974.1 DUF3137 domain-containing protein [Parvularcula marina]
MTENSTTEDSRAIDELIAERAAAIGGEFETRRVEAVSLMNKYRLYAGIAGGGALALLLVGAIFFDGLDYGEALMLAIGITVIGLAIAQTPGRRYKSSIKNEAFNRFVQSFGPEFQYRARGNIPMEFLRRSSLIPHHDKRRFEDYITGVWGGVRFSLMEAKLVDVRGSGKNKRDVTVFDGLFAVFEHKKDFSGRMIIRRDMGAIGNWFGDAFTKLERVGLEDPRFEKEFEVYSEDQIASRMLLTTTFMERLYHLAKDLGDGRMQAAFYEGKFLAMIPCRKNRFEPSLTLQPGAARRDLERFAEELKDIIQVADRLRLGEDLSV